MQDQRALWTEVQKKQSQAVEDENAQAAAAQTAKKKTSTAAPAGPQVAAKKTPCGSAQAAANALEAAQKNMREANEAVAAAETRKAIWDAHNAMQDDCRR